jgi:hypothetical protein
LLVSEIALDLQRRGLLTNIHELDNMDQTFLNKLLDEEHDTKIEAQALFRLTKILCTLHKREVVVLVDEYDTPTSYAAQYHYFDEVCLHKLCMVQNSLNIFKANIFFRKVFSPLLKVGVFTFYNLTTHSQNCRITKISEGL